MEWSDKLNDHDPSESPWGYVWHYMCNALMIRGIQDSLNIEVPGTAILAENIQYKIVNVGFYLAIIPI